MVKKQFKVVLSGVATSGARCKRQNYLSSARIRVAGRAYIGGKEEIGGGGGGTQSHTQDWVMWKQPPNHSPTHAHT